MKSSQQLIKIIWIIIIISVGLGGELQLENNNDGTWNVTYAISPALAISGFQFNVDGDGVTVDSAYGGAAETAEFIMTVNSTMVKGEKDTESTNIPGATGATLIVLKLSGAPTGLSSMVFSDSNEESMVFSFFWEGCPDDSACNFDENATEDNGFGSCLYSCSTPNGCENIDINFDCGGNCIVGLDCVGECGGTITDDGSCTGCMDDGFQQFSPNYGSPACDYDEFVTIRGDCLYNDCLGDCGGTADEDCAGTCREQNDEDWDLSCIDCNGILDGSAYLDACDQCVGGDTGIPDCLNINLSFGGYMESNSTDTIKVFVTNLDTLNSIDIEFQYDSSILKITDFSLYGTALFNSGYKIAEASYVEAGIFIKVKFTLYFEPHINTVDTSDELFLPNGNENIFNIILEAMDINADITTQIILNEFFSENHNITF